MCHNSDEYSGAIFPGVSTIVVSPTLRPTIAGSYPALVTIQSWDITVSTPPIAERFVRTVRSECLDWLLMLNAGHLEHVLTVFSDHYNGIVLTEA
jgi:hypothetical protein